LGDISGTSPGCSMGLGRWVEKGGTVPAPPLLVSQG
jgi:hypothetical protein